MGVFFRILRQSGLSWAATGCDLVVATNYFKYIVTLSSGVEKNVIECAAQFGPASGWAKFIEKRNLS